MSRGLCFPSGHRCRGANFSPGQPFHGTTRHRHDARQRGVVRRYHESGTRLRACLDHQYELRRCLSDHSHGIGRTDRVGRHPVGKPDSLRLPPRPDHARVAGHADGARQVHHERTCRRDLFLLGQRRPLGAGQRQRLSSANFPHPGGRRFVVAQRRVIGANRLSRCRRPCSRLPRKGLVRHRPGNIGRFGVGGRLLRPFRRADRTRHPAGRRAGRQQHFVFTRRCGRCLHRRALHVQCRHQRTGATLA